MGHPYLAAHNFGGSEMGVKAPEIRRALPKAPVGGGCPLSAHSSRWSGNNSRARRKSPELRSSNCARAHSLPREHTQGLNMGSGLRTDLGV